ncbi:MAG: hypothetical protein PQJ60_05865 [Spirochaetales bacterium]|nr:hypothetical protein [Spirochaetales bacterium]
MRKAAVLLFTVIPCLLWAQGEKSMACTLSGEGDREDYELQSRLVWRYREADGFYRLALKGGMDSLVPGEEEGDYSLGLSFASSFLTVGTPSLGGLYDLIESDDFPRLSSIGEKGTFSLNSDGNILDRSGMLLHNRNKSLILHGLLREDYFQTGLLWQGEKGQSSRGSGLLVYTWNLEEPEEEESWYTYDEGSTGEPLFHGLFRLILVQAGGEWEWTLAAVGSGIYSPSLYPGFGTYLLLQGVGDRGALALSLQGNGGYWRSCRGEGADWSRGLAWEGEWEPGNRLKLEGSGALYRPGVFSLEPGADLSRSGYTVEWQGKVKGAFFFLAWEGEKGEWEGTDDMSLEGGVFREKDHYKVDLSYREKKEDLWEGRFKTALRWTGESLSLQGSGGFYRPFDGADPFWAVEGEWEMPRKGTLALSLSGEGEEWGVEITFLSVVE